MFRQVVDQTKTRSKPKYPKISKTRPNIKMTVTRSSNLANKIQRSSRSKSKKNQNSLRKTPKKLSEEDW